VAGQRDQVVLAVIADGLGVRQVAERTGLSRQTLHAWLVRYEVWGSAPGGSAPGRPTPQAHSSGPYVEGPPWAKASGRTIMQSYSMTRPSGSRVTGNRPLTWKPAAS
jgi:hypothetical protein